MAVRRALVLMLALTLANALPTAHEVDYVENVRYARSTTRIVSGWEAREGQFPYQLSLRMVSPAGLVFSCGATVIHNEWALTAAHCTANRVSIVIRAGGVALSHPELLFETTEYYNHPAYDPAIARVQPHDIGVIKFGRSIDYSDHIQPIRLQSSADQNKDYSNVRLTASGWGWTWTNGRGPEVLNWVFLVGTSNQVCRSLFGAIIVDSTICASSYNVTSQSICQGDSGGPLVTIDVDGLPTEVGVTSFVSGFGCHLGFPAGFVRPGAYHSWFTEVTGINFDWEPAPAPDAAAPAPDAAAPAA